MNNRKKYNTLKLVRNLSITYVCVYLFIFIMYFITGISNPGMMLIDINQLFILHILFMIAGVIGTLADRKYKILKQGIEGEMYLEEVLSRLPNEYKTFYNTNISYDGKHSELDALVVGPTGLYIVETKNYKGRVYGNEDDNELVYEKISSSGNVYTQYIRNPIKQLNRQIYIFSNMLKDKGIKTWVDGSVFFVNGKVDITSDKVIIQSYQLLSSIQNKDHILSKEDINNVINKLGLR